MIWRWLRRKRPERHHALPADLIETVELVAAEDSRTCALALKMNGRIWHNGEEPALPLAGCDADHCRCLYAAVIDD